MKPDQPHPQQARENPEPEEGSNPMPWFVILLTASLLAFGVVYIARSDLTDPPAWGDGRSVADLQGAPPVAAGAALSGSACSAITMGGRRSKWSSSRSTNVPSCGTVWSAPSTSEVSK